MTMYSKGKATAYDCKTGKETLLDLSGVRPVGPALSPMEQGLGVAPMVIGKAVFHNQHLVNIFAEMNAYHQEAWLTKPLVSIIEEDYKNRKANPAPKEPLFVRVEFSGGPILQYPSRQVLCDTASAIQECTDWKPLGVMETYLLQHRKVEHVTFNAVPQYCDGRTSKDFIGETGKKKGLDLPMADGNLKTYSDEDVRARILGHLGPGQKMQSAGRYIRINEDEETESTEFSDAPFKVIRDYLYACSFLSPYAPGFIDYANDLLAYRLSYAISQEKDIGAREAISNLAHELNDFAKNHVDGAWGLRASTKVELFSGSLLPALTVRSDFGIIVVQYEPELTMLDWENRYADLRRRHAGR